MIGVAAIAGVQSYSHIYDLARSYGQPAVDARLLPLSVDGLILAASLVILHEAMGGDKAPFRAWLMLNLGIGATVAANVLSGLPHGPGDAIASAWAPVGFVGAVEIVMWMVRKARPEPGGESTPGPVAGTVSSDSIEAAMARLKIAQMHGFKISDNELRAQFRLTRSEATKARQAVLGDTNGHALEPVAD